MAARALLQRHAVAPLTATLLAGGIALYPAVAHAEAPAGNRSKKPIYDNDDPDVAAPPTAKPEPAQPVETPLPQAAVPALAAGTPATTHHQPRGPTPTDRLAARIGVARLHLYRQVCRAEDAVNAGMSRAFDLETSFTRTVAGLAPPRESGERVMPGLVYVLVAAMTGSIVARNRNVVLRAATPLALGVGAAWAVLPVTMGNVSALAWRYEQRFPAVAEAHVRARKRVERGFEMARMHGEIAAQKVDEAVGEAREKVEGWVRKGK